VSDNPTQNGEQTPRPRRQSYEEILLGILRESVKKASAELEGLVVPARIAEAEELAVKREWKEVNAKAINYAKGIATAKKFQSHHLLRELGIKLPSDGGGDNAAGKARRKNNPEKPKQGNAGEGAR
jgi:hypothetical protein